jgi:hypothetical protein
MTAESALGFVAVRDPDGVRVEDRISSRQYELRTAGAVDPSPVDADALAVPVSDAVALETSELRIADQYTAYVRTGDGELRDTVWDDTVAVPPGDHYLELGTPVKTYVGIQAGVDCTNTDAGLRVELDEPGRVVVGARPWRVSPDHESLVGEEPEDLLAALSYFGSALASRSPERSSARRRTSAASTRSSATSASVSPSRAAARRTCRS